MTTTNHLARWMARLDGLTVGIGRASMRVEIRPVPYTKSVEIHAGGSYTSGKLRNPTKREALTWLREVAELSTRWAARCDLCARVGVAEGCEDCQDPTEALASLDAQLAAIQQQPTTRGPRPQRSEEMKTSKLTRKQYDALAGADSETGRLPTSDSTDTGWSLAKKGLAALPTDAEHDAGKPWGYYITDAGREELATTKRPAAPKGEPTPAQPQAAQEWSGIVSNPPTTVRPVGDYKAGDKALVFAQGRWRQGIVTHVTKTRVHVLHVNPTSGTPRVKAQDADGVRLVPTITVTRGQDIPGLAEYLPAQAVGKTVDQLTPDELAECRSEQATAQAEADYRREVLDED